MNHPVWFNELRDKESKKVILKIKNFKQNLVFQTEVLIYSKRQST